MVGAAGRLASSSARTMRRYCHAPAAPPSRRSAIASAPSPSSSSRYTSPTRDESASRYPRSSVLTSSLGVTAPGSSCRSGKDVASAATASSSTRPCLGFNRDRAPWLSRRENPRNPGDALATHGHRTISRYFMTSKRLESGICCRARVRRRVSGRDLNPRGCELGFCLLERVERRITAGQAHVYVSDGGSRNLCTPPPLP
jgi:hypothetical protein